MSDKENLNTAPLKTTTSKENPKITEVGKTFSPKIEKILLASVIHEIKRLNPRIRIEHHDGILFCDDPKSLELPDGFYFSDINGITNKHTEESGIFVSINVYPLKYHPTNN